MKYRFMLWIMFLLLIPLAQAISNPINLTSNTITSNSFNVNWNDVVDADSYLVNVTTLPYNILIFSNNVSSSNISVLNVDENALYRVNIKAKNGTELSEEVYIDVATTSKRTLLSMDFDKNINIVIFVILSLLVVLLFLMQLYIFSGILLFIVGIIMIASGLNLALGIIAIFSALFIGFLDT